MDSAISLLILLGISTIIVAALISILWVGLVMSGNFFNGAAQMSALYLSTSTISSKMFLRYDDVLASYWNTTLTPDATGRYIHPFDLAELRTCKAPRYSAAAAYVFLQENAESIDAFHCPLCKMDYKGADMGVCLFSHSQEPVPSGSIDAANVGFLVFVDDPIATESGGQYEIFSGVIPEKSTSYTGLYAIWVR